MEIDWNIVNSHLQKYQYSCIPSAVELVLKLSGKVSLDYYELQNAWDNKTDGSFRDFDEKIIQGIKFKLENGFPSISDLFRRISQELDGKRYVIISLKDSLIDITCKSNDYHMCVIFDCSVQDGDFRAFTKNWESSRLINNVKRIVEAMGTTDILTYNVLSASSQRT
jgi:hypothetical protein